MSIDREKERRMRGERHMREERETREGRERREEKRRRFPGVHAGVFPVHTEAS